MRLDYTPLYRSTVGFDRLFQMLDSIGDGDGGYPPYNIERLAENSYKITMAVAGFTADEIKAEVKDTVLTVRGEKQADTTERQYLHRGIAARSFERRFQLADHVEVKAADLRDGILSIELERHLPERLKPRSIPIGTAGNEPKQIESKAA